MGLVFGGGLFDWFHLAMLGYQPQQSVWQLRQEAFTAINWEGVTAIIIVMNPLDVRSSKRADQGLESKLKQDTEVGYIALKTKY